MIYHRQVNQMLCYQKNYKNENKKMWIKFQIAILKFLRLLSPCLIMENSIYFDTTKLHKITFGHFSSHPSVYPFSIVPLQCSLSSFSVSNLAFTKHITSVLNFFSLAKWSFKNSVTSLAIDLFLFQHISDTKTNYSFC